MKNKRLIIYVLIANLFCVFPFAHAAIPLAFFQLMLIINRFSISGRSQEMWIVAVALLLIGQTTIITALFQTTEKKLNTLGFVGILFLLMGTAALYYNMPERDWSGCLLFAAPFIFLSVKFVKRLAER